MDIDLDLKKITVNVFYLFLILTVFLFFKKTGIPEGLEEKIAITTLLFGALTVLLRYDECLNFIKQFKNRGIKNISNGLPEKTIIFFIVSIGSIMVIIYYYTQVNSYLIKAVPYLLLIYFIVSLKLKLDSRIPIALALGLLFLTAITLVQGFESSANQLAIFAYYLLVVGVVLQLIEYIKEPEKVNYTTNVYKSKQKKTFYPTIPTPRITKRDASYVVYFLLTLAASIVIILFASKFLLQLKDLIPYFILIYFFISLILKLDSRIPIAFALFLLFLTAITLVQGLENAANQVAIYAYYLLVAGVVLQLIEYIQEPEKAN